MNYTIKILPDTNISTLSVVASLGGMVGDITCSGAITCSGQNIAITTSPTFTGTLTAGTLTLSAIATSAGGGGLFVCIDTAGVMYKKATCP